MIPNHVIDKFKETFKQEPSIVRIERNYIKTDLEKLFKRSRLIWTFEEIDENGNKKTISKSMEYDPTGVFVFINEKDELFILTTIERKNVVDFMVNSLKYK